MTLECETIREPTFQPILEIKNKRLNNINITKTLSMNFNHKLYGKARLITNKSFKPCLDPIAINYVILGSDTIQSSSIRDSGIIITPETLIKYKYKSN